jgi:hypothetical protein
VNVDEKAMMLLAARVDAIEQVIIDNVESGSLQLACAFKSIWQKKYKSICEQEDDFQQET